MATSSGSSVAQTSSQPPVPPVALPGAAQSDVEMEVLDLLQTLQKRGLARLTGFLPGAKITVLRASAGQRRRDGYLALGLTDLEGRRLSFAIPPALARRMDGGAELAIVSYNARADFPEGGSLDYGDVLPPVFNVRLWQDGAFRPIVNLTAAAPFLFTMPRNRTLTPTAECNSWDAEAGRWASAGVTELESTEDAVSVASDHFGTFALLGEAFLAQLQCANVEVVTPAGLRRLASTWVRHGPGVLLIFLVVYSAVLVLHGLREDREVRRADLWQDAYYFTHVPEYMRTPTGLRYVAFLAASAIAHVRRLCSAGCSQQRLRVASLLRDCAATGTAVGGVQSVVAVRHGLAREEVGEHVWGSRGFVQVDLAKQRSRRLCRRLDAAQATVPSTFREFFVSKRFWGRFWVLLRAEHPLCDLCRLDLRMSAAKRSKLLLDAHWGALVLSALFFSATGSALSVRSPAACANERLNPIRLVIIGLLSSLLIKLPLAMVAQMHLRTFVHEDQWGVETQKVQIGHWRRMDALFWTCGLAWSALCVLFLAAFLANLSTKDSMKWIIVFFSVTLRMMVVWPVLAALARSLAASLLALLRPSLAADGDARLGIHLRSEEAHAKVEELAGRSMTVGDLLDFYAMLGTKGVMPFFDPEQSTTHDVVRQAIIPLSRCEDMPGGGAAYATLAALGEERLANKMVTHNWGNKFSHLLAAIFADCLNHHTFSACLDALMRRGEGVAELRHKLKAKLHKTYWVCAFCVNQHAGICAQTPPVDSTGYAIEKCGCPHEKYTAGDLCEMDKFDQMMRYLQAASPGFMQVVAVDSDFTVFSRIWCVAELLEAKRLGLPQALQIQSQACLDAHREDLKEFDVRLAQSSVAEDRDRILSKVDDKDEFNEQLKELILHPVQGLLALWTAEGALFSVTSALFERSGDVVLQQAVDAIV